MQSTSSGRPQFSIATIFLAMTLLSICLAVVWYVPCLGFVLLVVGPPAIVRAAVVGYYHRRAGETLTVGDKIEIVVVSVYAALIAFLWALMASFVAWFVITMAPVPDPLAIVLSIPAGLAAFVFSLWCSTFPQELESDRDSLSATSHAATGRRK
ncbi:MAG TPA: hypothetical protein VMP01_26080 [Pirellulaceae bacterium]|nr:hypothetical protein [Pirellulaceae bacterium]